MKIKIRNRTQVQINIQRLHVSNSPRQRTCACTRACVHVCTHNACMHARAKPKQQHPQDTDEWYLKNITVAVPKRRQILYFPSKKPPTATWRQLTRSFFWLRYFSRFHWRGLKMSRAAGRRPSHSCDFCSYFLSHVTTTYLASMYVLRVHTRTYVILAGARP